MNRDVVLTRVIKSVWTLPMSRQPRATSWTAKVAAHQRPHALTMELDIGPNIEDTEKTNSFFLLSAFLGFHGNSCRLCHGELPGKSFFREVF